MRKKQWFTLAGVVLAGFGFAQVKKQFTVEDSKGCDHINFCLRANNGNCFIKPSQSTDLLTGFSNQDQSAYSHNFKKEIHGKTCNVLLKLEESQVEGVSHSMSARFFGSESSADRFWKMYLTDAKPYFLDLHYGVGNAYVDLSGLAIKKLKINTASADVNVCYLSLENQVDMDTFFIRVDLGSVNVKNINLSRSRYVLADVGFGSMMLDFSNKPMISNSIKGSVGAGNLVIILPNEETPIIVKINDSWLCRVKMPGYLKKINDNTFANAAYAKSTKNSLSFDLDVSMGNIIFKDKTSN